MRRPKQQTIPNVYDLEHVCTAHPLMTKEEWHDIYLRADSRPPPFGPISHAAAQVLLDAHPGDVRHLCAAQGA